jgi:hypothetical protein
VLLFRGRALYPEDDFYNRRTITCEGERCFFRDGVHRPYVYQDGPAAIFSTVVELYNAQVDEFKRFKVGTVTVTDPNNYIRLESESAESFAATIDKLVERCGGYVVFTTNADGDRWFVGYTPELICGVWCGYEYPQPLEGRNLCTNIWNRVMSDIVEEKGGKDRFDVPQNVIRASYCKDSGKLLSDACGYDARGNRSEIGWFLKENMPTSFCDCHVLCNYDSDHGGISHGNCPDSFLKKVIFI